MGGPHGTEQTPLAGQRVDATGHDVVAVDNQGFVVAGSGAEFAQRIEHDNIFIAVKIFEGGFFCAAFEEFVESIAPCFNRCTAILHRFHLFFEFGACGLNKIDYRFFGIFQANDFFTVFFGSLKNEHIQHRIFFVVAFGAVVDR